MSSTLNNYACVFSSIDYRVSVRQRGRSIRRSQRASQRSDDTFKSDSDTLSYSISDPDRHGCQMAVARFLDPKC